MLLFIESTSIIYYRVLIIVYTNLQGLVKLIKTKLEREYERLSETDEPPRRVQGGRKDELANTDTAGGVAQA